MAEQIALNIDCMEYMKTLSDKAFDLAVVDPPYGINIQRSGRLKKYNNGKNWDNQSPFDDYFLELERVSKHRIIWGENYFYLPPTKCFLIWDKQQPTNISFASCEFAWTDFDSVAKTFYKNPLHTNENRIHPTQKPVELYEWIFRNYAKESDKILDTHLGSGSSRIAARIFNLDFAGCELDKTFFDLQEKRWHDYCAQAELF